MAQQTWRVTTQIDNGKSFADDFPTHTKATEFAETIACGKEPLRFQVGDSTVLVPAHRIGSVTIAQVE